MCVDRSQSLTNFNRVSLSFIWYLQMSLHIFDDCANISYQIGHNTNLHIKLPFGCHIKCKMYIPLKLYLPTHVHLRLSLDLR